jgi:glyceraldehyde 3-phosphate dehydrogenase
MGINEEQYNPDNHQILSNTSCTANCLVPLVQVLWHQFGIIKGMINTVHCCTNNQALLDTPHKDLRRARATGLSMIPTSTGAAEAVSEILPYMKGKLSEIAVRVPTASVSLIDLVIETEKNTDRQQVNDAFKSFESGSLRNILGVCEAPLVSADFVGSHLSCTIDALSTEVLGGNMVRVLAWYDNEWGYSNRIVDLLHYMEAKRTENALAS